MSRRARIVSIRRSILNNMLLLVALFAVAVLATTVIGANQMAATLSRTLIGQTISRTESEVREFISPVERSLSLVESWLRYQQFDPVTGQGAEGLLLPMMREIPQLFATMITDPDGNTMMLSRLDGQWFLTLVDAAADTTSALRAQLDVADSSFADVEYNLVASGRPWYAGALASPDRSTYWTEAYRFYESNLPGMTASRRVEMPSGDTWVIAFDVLLEAISDFTRNFNVGYQGLVLITDGHSQVIGLPNLPMFASPKVRSDAYLKSPTALGLNLASDATDAFRPDPTGPVVNEPVQFRSDGRTWWGQGKWIELGHSKEIWAGVVVPEAQLLGNLNQLRILIITVTFLVTALAVTRAIVLARQYSVPIRALARQSLRISTGNLEADEPIESMISEVRRLSEAHDRMRESLASLLKLEGDLQVARQIQQATFPAEFPDSSQIEIAAGSRPADATGGDTYDVIGVSGSGSRTRLIDHEPERLLLMLADATGHGLGPALTASQVRAMFRMGVRMGSPLNSINCQMNDQLYSDVHEGRFVTAWLGQIDCRSGQVDMLSAGQAPVLVYRRASDSFDEIQADGPPLGVIESPAEHPQPTRITLHGGDILIVLSDGAFDAKAFDGDRFGRSRIEQLVRVNRDQAIGELLNRIKDEIDRFASGRPMDDDQTGIFIRRR